MGGPSAEHEVSLNTGKNIIHALDPKKYLVRPVLITKKSKWLIAPSYQTPLLYSQRKLAVKNLVPLAENPLPNRVFDSPVAFIAMHGKYGEDGTIQGMLETMGIPYTGSGILASALGMDKPRSLSLFRDNGFNVPDYRVFNQQEKIINPFQCPLVVKPSNHGSSIGVSIVRHKRDFKNALVEAFRHSNHIILQKFIKGRELTCGVLENKNGEAFALLPTEIIPRVGNFYDYRSKYDEGGSEHVVPPHGFSQKTISMVQNTALYAHKIIGCSDMSRSDFILGSDNKLYILEINTIPGMTQTSLLPEAAKAAGINFPKLLDLLIARALRKQ